MYGFLPENLVNAVNAVCETNQVNVLSIKEYCRKSGIIDGQVGINEGKYYIYSNLGIPKHVRQNVSSNVKVNSSEILNEKCISLQENHWEQLIF